MSTKSWSESIKSNLDELEEVKRNFDLLKTWMMNNLSAKDELPAMLPEQASEFIDKIRKSLAIIQKSENELFNRFSSEPVGKYALGAKLSREEFYFLKAMDVSLINAKDLNLGNWDDFDFFNLLTYKDDQRCGYINPTLLKDEIRKVEIKFGISPENIKLSALRPEQHDFFSKYLPAVYARFK
jgi:hypothetical protein